MITDIGFFIPFNIERLFIQGFDFDMNSFQYLKLLIINIVIGSFGVFLILLICEIIECDCYNFNKYTKKNIKKRQLLETLNEEFL